MRDSKVDRVVRCCRLVGMCRRPRFLVESARRGAIPVAWREGGCGGHGERSDRFASQARRRSRASCPRAEPKACRCTRSSPVQLRTKRRHARRPSKPASWGSSCCDRFASTRKSRRGPDLLGPDVRRLLGRLLRPWLGFSLVGWGNSYGHYHHRRDARVLVKSEQARVAAAKQDYESCKSESPDREHGQTGCRRARAARADYERADYLRDPRERSCRARACPSSCCFRRTLGSIAWERRETNMTTLMKVVVIAVLASCAVGCVTNPPRVMTELSPLRWKTTPSPVPTITTRMASVYRGYRTSSTPTTTKASSASGASSGRSCLRCGRRLPDVCIVGACPGDAYPGRHRDPNPPESDQPYAGICM